MTHTQTYKISLCLLISCLFIVTINAQEADKKSLDRAAIKAMTGCYNVEFKYTETFAPEIDYEHAYDYTSAAFEWAELVEETEDKIVLQHLLIIQKDTLPPYIVKHWRQDWVYEADRSFKYDKDNRWLFEESNPEKKAGTWTQKVYQVDDSPRYSGTATWTHVDGISSWYHKADSPLPRREYTKRDDYNVMKRGNRIQILDNGWLHEQDNDKIIRSDSKDVLLVQEKGYNTYTNRPNEDCQAAQDWWKEHKNMWADVREVWDEIYASKDVLHLEVKKEDKRLYEHLFYSDESWIKEDIKELIESYIVKEDSPQDNYIGESN